MESILDAIEVVDAPEAGAKEVSLGARVTLELAEGETESYSVVGLDEVAFEPKAVSWIYFARQNPSRG